MIEEIFETKRDFFKKYPSKTYICSNCGNPSKNALFCKKCGWRADGLLKTFNNGYILEIKELNLKKEIFKPIETLYYGIS